MPTIPIVEMKDIARLDWHWKPAVLIIALMGLFLSVSFFVGTWTGDVSVNTAFLVFELPAMILAVSVSALFWLGYNAVRLLCFHQLRRGSDPVRDTED